MSFQPVLDSLVKILTDILDFIPRFINGLIILTVGYLVCIIVRFAARWILRRVRLQQLAERTGIVAALQSLGVRAPVPDILTQVIFFFLFLSFATAAVRLMGLTAVAELLENVLRFIPRAISAGLLLIFGSMLARFLGNTISALAENIGITYGRALGRVLEYLIVVFTAILAISTLGVDTSILTSSLTIIIASAGLALALTFGLGSREAAKNVIAGYYVRQNYKSGQEISIDNYSGVVRSVAGAFTTIETANEDGTTSLVSVPNTTLLERIVPSRTRTQATEK